MKIEEIKWQLNKRYNNIDDSFFKLALAVNEVNKDEPEQKKINMFVAENALKTLLLTANSETTIPDKICESAIQIAENILSEHKITPQTNCFDWIEWEIGIASEIAHSCKTLLEENNILTCFPFYTNQVPCVNTTGKCASQHSCPYCVKCESI